MICNVKLNLYELQKLGEALEFFYNSQFEKIIHYNSCNSMGLDFDELLFEDDNNKSQIISINKLVILLDKVHKVNQSYLNCNDNKYKISISLIEKKKEMLIIQANNIDRLIYQMNSNILKQDNIEFIRTLEYQIERIQRAIDTLDKLKEELMSREIIELDEILDIDELC